MPGEAQLPTVQHPDDYQFITFAQAAATAPTALTVLFTADRDLVVDQVQVACATSAAAETITVRWSPSGTAPAATADNGTTFNDIVAATSMDPAATYTKTLLTLNPTNEAPTRNVIPAGATVYASFSAVVSVKGVSINLRVRSRRA